MVGVGVRGLIMNWRRLLEYERRDLGGFVNIVTIRSATDLGRIPCVIELKFPIRTISRSHSVQTSRL